MFLPEPYPDELLYSILARYHFRSRNNSYKETIKDAFGKSTVCAVIDFPAHLEALCERLPERFAVPPDYFIEHHTLFPLFKPFLPIGRADRIVEMMKGAKGNGIHTTLGVMAGCLPSLRYLRYCSQCICDDEAMFGETYWHRSHQIFGIFICPKHHEWLKNSKIAISSGRNKHVFGLINCEKNDSSLAPADADEKVLFYLMIAEGVYWILNNRVQVMEPDKLRKAYLGYLQERGLVTHSGRLHQQDLQNEFTARYGMVLLKKLCCSVNHSRDNWLFKILRKPRTVIHPLRHLLLIDFLGLTPESFFQNYKLSVDNVDNRILQHQAGQRKSDTIITPEQIINYRERWVNTLQNNPGLGRKMLRLMAYAEYTWLYRHDRKWLFANQPLILPKGKNTIQRVDWNKRDLELTEKVKSAGIGLLFKTDHLVRLTYSSIGKEVGELMLIQKHLAKLPKTKEMLDLLIETKEQFRCRRVRHSIHKLSQSGKPVTRWRVIRESRLRPDISEKVSLEIEKVIYLGMELK
jgi:hypothetical protein